MTQEHSITPPLKLMNQWEDDILNNRDNVDYVLDCAWRDGFHTGADQELEACCEWVSQFNYDDYSYQERLRAARRCSKPQTLNSIALQMLGTIERDAHYLPEITDTIRRALEQLND